MTRSLQLMAIALLALPAAAQAQTAADRAYCSRLGAIYEHYLGRSNASPCPHGNEPSSYEMSISGIMIRSTRLTSA